MRGSLVGLALDDSVHDLAAKFHVTLEAIALQTRHIVDTMNEHGHAVNSLYLSGSQAKNAPLMALLADCCGMDVVIPNKPGVAVVLGAAMLGRMAAEVSGGQLAEMQGAEQAEKLWNIMVSLSPQCGRSPTNLLQTEMTPPARVVSPSASPREKKLLEAKYQIFRESIEIQKRWRVQMEQAASE
jgi:glycerol kinase